MDIKDRELFGEFSSYEEILDFDQVLLSEEVESDFYRSDDEPFYRSLNEY